MSIVNAVQVQSQQSTEFYLITMPRFDMVEFTLCVREATSAALPLQTLIFRPFRHSKPEFSRLSGQSTMDYFRFGQPTLRIMFVRRLGGCTLYVVTEKSHWADVTVSISALGVCWVTQHLTSLEQDFAAHCSSHHQQGLQLHTCICSPTGSSDLAYILDPPYLRLRQEPQPTSVKVKAWPRPACQTSIV